MAPGSILFIKGRKLFKDAQMGSYLWRYLHVFGFSLVTVVIALITGFSNCRERGRYGEAHVSSLAEMPGREDDLRSSNRSESPPRAWSLRHPRHDLSFASRRPYRNPRVLKRRPPDPGPPHPSRRPPAGGRPLTWGADLLTLLLGVEPVLVAAAAPVPEPRAAPGLRVVVPLQHELPARPFFLGQLAYVFKGEGEKASSEPRPPARRGHRRLLGEKQGRGADAPNPPSLGPRCHTGGRDRAERPEQQTRSDPDRAGRTALGTPGSGLTGSGTARANRPAFPPHPGPRTAQSPQREPGVQAWCFPLLGQIAIRRI